jgi:Biotin-lipoyl like
VVFKVFRIPVNQWSLATAALGGIIGIALLLLIMNYNHPFTKNARIYFAVTSVLPTLRGRVIDVPVKENAPLKEGDVLFRIDPKPNEYVVEQKKAALAEAEQNVRQLKASLDQAAAATEKANAQFELAQQNYDRQAELFQTRGSSHRRPSTLSRVISKRHDRVWPGRKPRRSVRTSPIPPTSRASTLRLPASALNWAMQNGISSRPSHARRARDSSPRSRCGRAYMSSRRRCGRRWSSSIRM